MQAYEYKVIPAPRRGEKVRGARSVPERFAVALTQAMNAHLAEIARTVAPFVGEMIPRIMS